MVKRYSKEWKEKISKTVCELWSNSEYRLVQRNAHIQHARRLKEEGREQDRVEKIRATMNTHNRFGKNNPNWKGGSKGDYPNAFSKKLRQKILKRDSYLCKHCDGVHKGYRLEVHHIDHDKNNNNENNLVTLCSKCHPIYTHGVYHEASLVIFDLIINGGERTQGGLQVC